LFVVVVPISILAVILIPYRDFLSLSIVTKYHNDVIKSSPISYTLSNKQSLHNTIIPEINAWLKKGANG